MTPVLGGESLASPAHALANTTANAGRVYSGHRMLRERGWAQTSHQCYVLHATVLRLRAHVNLGVNLGYGIMYQLYVTQDQELHPTLRQAFTLYTLLRSVPASAFDIYLVAQSRVAVSNGTILAPSQRVGL